MIIVKSFVLLFVLFILSNSSVYAEKNKQSDHLKEVGINIKAPIDNSIDNDIVNSIPGTLISAEIWNDILHKYEPIIGNKTDHLGAYHFKDLKKGKYRLLCQLPINFHDLPINTLTIKYKKRFLHFIIIRNNKNNVYLASKTGKNKLNFISSGFNIDSTNNSMDVFVVVSINNYGINDEGIK